MIGFAQFCSSIILWRWKFNFGCLKVKKYPNTSATSWRWEGIYPHLEGSISLKSRCPLLTISDWEIMVQVRTSTVFWKCPMMSKFTFMKYKRSWLGSNQKYKQTNKKTKYPSRNHQCSWSLNKKSHCFATLLHSLVCYSVWVLWLTVDSACEMVWWFSFVIGFYLRSLFSFSGYWKCSISNVGNCIVQVHLDWHAVQWSKLTVF